MRRTIVFSAFIVFLVTALTCYFVQAQTQDYNDLVSIAKTEGTAAVIVRLNVPFQTLGKLKDAKAVQDQMASIDRGQSTLLNSVAGLNVTNIKRYSYVPLIAMHIGESALVALSKNPLVVSISEDVAEPPALLESVPLIEANVVWTEGYNGGGQTIAILDTGIDKNHPMLDNGKVVAEACYSTTKNSHSSKTVCPNGQNSQIGPGAAMYCSIESCEHGTHVAGIAAGNDPSRNGVAKDADIIAVQVFSKFNSSACSSYPSPCVLSYRSDQLSALEYIYSLRDTYNIASVNMSLGGGRYLSNCDDDPRKIIIDNLLSEGIATVIASGNGGYKNSISMPACISTAVSVGATNDITDKVDSYSNSASFLSLLAPGSNITSSIPGGRTDSLSGTSMAAPHVSGAWAVLKQKAPSATVGTILSALQATGVPIRDTNGITIPRINVNNALNALDINVSPALISFGSLNPGTSLSRTLTVRNNGTADLVLGSIAGADPVGDPFSIITDNCSVQTLAPSASCTLMVRFAPAITGIFSDTFDIPSNDPDENPVTVSLSGTGFEVGEDFETGGLSNFRWVTGGNDRWTVQNGVKLSGNFSAEAPKSIKNSQSSYLEIKLNITTAGNIFFLYRVSSELNWDYLKFKVDGVEKDRWSGEEANSASYAVDAGLHTFRWEYTKDNSDSRGNDTAWIDDIVFPPTYIRPDLVVRSVSNPPESRKSGGSFSVTAKIRNKGTGAADEEFSIGYYLSKNRDKRINKESDILLSDNVFVPSLLVEARSKEIKILSIPFDTPAGKYYVKVCADNTFDVEESNEDNNCTTSTGKISVK